MKMIQQLRLHKKAEIHGKLAMVYAGSHSEPEQFIKYWKKDYKPGSGAGQARGPGLYTVYNPNETATMSGEYGNYVYQFIVNLENYLILVDEKIDLVYPELSGLPYSQKLLKQFERFKITNKKAIELANYSEEPIQFTSDLASIIQEAGLHYGIVYRGRGDGECCLIQIPEQAKLVGYTEIETGKKKRFIGEELREINHRHKKLNLKNRSFKDLLLEFSELYPEKTLTLAQDHIESIKEKNPSADVDFYRGIKHKIAETWAKEGNRLFFRHGLHGDNDFKPLVEKIAETWAKEGNELFFYYGLHEYDDFKPLAEKIAETWAKEGNRLFFYYSLHKDDDFKWLIEETIKAWAEKGNELFFRHGLHGDNDFKPLAEKIAETWAKEGNELFFEYRLHEYDVFKPLVEKIAETWAKEGNELFFYYGLHEYDDFKPLAEKIAETWAKEGNELFFDRWHRLDKKYPELVPVIAKAWAESGDENFFLHKDKLGNAFHNFMPIIAKTWAEEGNRLFFGHGLDQDPDFKDLTEHFGDKEYFKKLREQRSIEENKRVEEEQQVEEEKDNTDTIEEKLASLYKFLTKTGLKKEALLIKRIIKRGHLQ